MLEAFVEEAASLDSFLADLTAEQWLAESACPGWTVSDVVLHLAQSEEGVVGSFDRDDPTQPYLPYVEEVLPGAEAGGAVDTVASAAVAGERPEDPSEVLDRWRAAHAAVIERFSAAPPGRRLAWISVPLSARTLAATRLSEHWIHGMDIREPLGRPAADTDRLGFVARLAWRTLPYAFAQRGETAPSVSLVLTAPGGGTWHFGEDGAAVTVEGPAGEWCRVAARRVSPDQTSLQASGPGSGRVLELARTYA